MTRLPFEFNFAMCLKLAITFTGELDLTLFGTFECKCPPDCKYCKVSDPQIHHETQWLNDSLYKQSHLDIMRPRRRLTKRSNDKIW